VNIFFRFANPGLIIVLCIFWALVLVFRFVYYRGPVYRYALVHSLMTSGMASMHPYKKIVWLLRVSALTMLIFYAGRPQLVDVHSKVSVQGIDIILVLDLSGSMLCRDYKDNRSRFDVAQAEAIRFVQLRPNDAIGLVFFGQDALSRCPLTLDKRVLESILKNAHVGIIDPRGTMLMRSIVCAINRLKKSYASSKVMIVLTDGSPSPGDIDPSAVIMLCKQLGIKMYTMGIGSEEGGVFIDPVWGPVQGNQVNSALLRTCAEQTGGYFFLAQNAQDMRNAYNMIDKMEKNTHEEPIFTRYHDLYLPWAWFILIILFVEVLVTATCWFGI
jgi:Ca-activated chloride channel homolog